MLDISVPDGPTFETGVCSEHWIRIDAGEKWVWTEDEKFHGSILMGSDLDSGGAVVLGAWRYVEQMGLQELIIDCTTPSGAAREPLRIWITPDELKNFLGTFKTLYPTVFDGQ